MPRKKKEKVDPNLPKLVDSMPRKWHLPYGESLEEYIAGLASNLKELQKAGHEEISIEHESEYGYYDETYHSLMIKSKRLETDKEVKRRLELAAKKAATARRHSETQKKIKEEKELKELARLKKKYPNAV